ncbi:unnamed protein product [Paramecium octaurelia]|uniref:Uncharacterized protein n=1 Tax=Paramecium octaurelia TaxID=43137 RepID=A0A8S1VXY7_PAROT|nr:unnamed protein product [Paramecium octaurelia]
MSYDSFQKMISRERIITNKEFTLFVIMQIIFTFDFHKVQNEKQDMKSYGILLQKFICQSQKQNKDMFTQFYLCIK